MEQQFFAYKDYLTSAYKSFEQPDFSFVKRVFNARPYEPLIRKMRDYAAIEECTHSEDDVCFSYFLKGRTNLWKLDLSLVGPFAIFVRLRSRIAEEDFLYPTKFDLADFEAKIITMMTQYNIRLLTSQELRIEVPIGLYSSSKEKPRLYHALFSDSEKLPWEN
jgi:hypothetical protein